MTRPALSAQAGARLRVLHTLCHRQASFHFHGTGLPMYRRNFYLRKCAKMGSRRLAWLELPILGGYVRLHANHAEKLSLGWHPLLQDLSPPN